MGLGVLQDRHLQQVPGTATLNDISAISSAAELSHRHSSSNLKHSLGPNPVVLVPQPSDDPADPLNWPLWRRDLILALLSLLSVLASTLSPLLAANTLVFTLHFEVSFSVIALLTGYHLLGVGLAGFLFVPSARVWGKRHLYVLGTVVIIISSVWGGASAASYKSLLAARVFQGVGLAPFEALVNASVADLFFVHERGKRMALSNLALFGGAFFTPVVVGKMTASLGWQWSFYFIAIFAALLLPPLLLFVPETAFRRDAPAPAASLVPADDADANADEKTAGADASAAVVYNPTGRPTIRSTLPLFNGRKTDERYLSLLLRPFPLFLQPAILTCCLLQGAMIGWTVMIGIVLAAIMLGPPLFFDEVETGYMYTGAFAGAIIGFVLAGLLADASARAMTRANSGVYEPEFRLVLVLPMLVLGCAGLYGFGIVSADTTRYGWFWPDFFFALQVAGMVLGAVAAALYVADAHPNHAVEAFTCMLVFKNIFSFGLTFSGYQWLVDAGIRPVFVAVASVQVGVCLLAVPLYVFGKRNRSFWARSRVLGRLGLS